MSGKERLTSIQKIRIVAQKTRESYHGDIPLDAIKNLDQFDAAIADVEQQLRAAAQASGLIPAFREYLASREFYDLMQTYRHTAILPPGPVVEAYEAVKAALLAAAERPHP